MNSYPTGVPATVDVSPYLSLSACLRSACQSFANLPAFSDLDTSIRYTEWDRYSRHFAAYLQNVQSLRHGHRIALMMPNLLQYPVALLAAWRVGLVVVNINPDSTAEELEYQLKDADVSAIVVCEEMVPTLQRVLEWNPDLVLSVVITQPDDLRPHAMGAPTSASVKYRTKESGPWQIAESEPFDAALRGGEGFELQEPASYLADIALLQYTKGSTGLAKGVMLTHGNLLAVMAQLGEWITPVLRRGQEVCVCPSPLWRIDVLAPWMVLSGVGAHSILLADSKDLGLIAQTLGHYPVTVILGLNTLYGSLLKAPGFAASKMPTLKCAHAVGMAVQASVAERWKKATGVPIIQAYGPTECTSAASCKLLDNVELIGTIGQALPATEIAVKNETGQEVPQGTTGEIWIRGPQVMQGYWLRKQETEQVLTATGWLHTGDMGFMDRYGYIWMTGRKRSTLPQIQDAH
ncbi:long-chain-fatty-acid--CoA ligase [Rhodoferax lacus]|uniref:Long-chain-fatty-acid--CoA ligase n=1 Tax=Rhodoferax lacus TaxID=2184758 RepID=A0A3E1R686_9BURK|nr:AMP-binding protein [Rhodoferax lacus]RFO94879.1 long-chain-fatty-acid--CoA ligase [Rhodoferax lacus]